MDEEKSERNIIQFDKNYIIGQTPVNSNIFLPIYAQVSITPEQKWTIRAVIYPEKNLNCNVLGTLSECIKSIDAKDIIFDSREEAYDYLTKLSESYNWEYTFDC